MCIHCGTHPNSNRCYIKYPYLDPTPPRRSPNRFIAEKNHANILQISRQKTTQHHDSVCLLGVDLFLLLMCHSMPIRNNILPTKWVFYSGYTNHFTYDRTSFDSCETTNPTSPDFGASSTAQILGTFCVSLDLLVHYKPAKCKINDVNHVLDLRY